MAFSTDTVVNLPGKNRGQMSLDFLKVWTDAGVPAPEILKAMTTNCADLLGITKERGAIAAGSMPTSWRPPPIRCRTSRRCGMWCS